MCDQTIALHFSHAQSAISRPSLEGLSSEHGHRSTSTGMHLVVDQMLQSLIERWSDKDTGIQWSPRVTLIHVLVPVLLIAHGMEAVANIFDRNISKGRRVTFASLEDNHLSKNTLNQLSDSHTGWNGVRVHDNVGNDAFDRPWHIFLTIGHSNRSLLPVPRCKLVSNLRDTNVSDPNLSKSIPFFGCTHENVIDNTIFVGLHRRRNISFRKSGRLTDCLILRNRLSDQDILSRDTSAR
mmetsp:Transcript_10986/g.16053  ORF Transcript_10986/g.16053 Transcript_10986/m.16053 type:complete len:238 (-) Transcript_10986:1894-2607(-)